MQERCSAYEEPIRRSRIGNEFHGFLDLPYEIRRMIYSMLLVRGKIFVHDFSEVEIEGRLLELEHPVQTEGYQKSFLRYLDKPPRDKRDRTTTGLIMGVNKQVQREAEQVFWSSSNTFVIPSKTSQGPIGSDRLRPDIIIPPIQCLSVAFDMRDHVRPDADDGFWKDQIKEFYELDPDFAETTPRQRLRQIHYHRKEVLEDHWQYRWNRIRRQLKLKYLQICFEECHCPIGCCRMVGKACSQLGPWAKGFPERVEILGATNAREKAMILKRIEAKNPGLGIRNMVTFVEHSRRKDEESG